MTISKMKYPRAVISDKGLEFLRKGQRWMYRNNLIRVDDDAQDGEPVCIVSEQGEYIATGFYSAVSHVCVRILTVDEDAVINDAFFIQRLTAAWNYRKHVEPDNLDNCRIVFGDGDLLPGLTIDRYNDTLVSQIICAGMEKRKDMLYAAMIRILQEDHQDVRYVYERNDVKARGKEGLDLYKGFHGGTGKTDLVIHENGLLLNVDIENGQKSGYFLDQKSNRMLIRKLAKGMKVLDCFTHTGGFALNAAIGGAAHVIGVDVSETALKEAEANAKLNHLSNAEFVQADVFDYLDSIEEGQFDLIILDPPAFTKSRKTVEHAYHGYQTINEKAMHVLKHGGYLATCSCSRYMETELFEQMLRESAMNQHVLLRQISVSQQNSDHPILWSMEQTSYLKFFLFQIL